MRKRVVLKALPAGFLGHLPKKDQEAISTMVGKQITLTGYDDDGRAKLEFTDMEGVIHTIYVDPSFLEKSGDE